MKNHIILKCNDCKFENTIQVTGLKYNPKISANSPEGHSKIDVGCKSCQNALSIDYRVWHVDNKMHDATNLTGCKLIDNQLVFEAA